jgi:hypothetical protein
METTKLYRLCLQTMSIRIYVRVDNSSLLDDLLSNAAYRTMSSVKSYIDSEVLASESYCVIYIIVIAIRHEMFYYIW